MCGILGLVSHSPLKKYDKAIRKLFEESEKRGTDAMGMFLFNVDGSPIIEIEGSQVKEQLFKDETHPSRFYKEQRGELILDRISCLFGHTRAGTGASASQNKNNHPFESKDFVWAHNGVIGKHVELKKEYELNYDSDCDSAVIGNIAQKYLDEGRSVKDSVFEAAKILAEKSAGSFAVWLVHKPTRRMFFFRNNNPIEYVFLNDGTFVFASVSHYIKDAFKNMKEFNEKSTTSIIWDRLYELVPEGKSFKLEVVSDLPKVDTGMYQKPKTSSVTQAQLVARPAGNTAARNSLGTVKKSIPKALAERAVALSDALSLEGWFCRRRNSKWVFVTAQQKLIEALEKGPYHEKIANVDQAKVNESRVVMLELTEEAVERFLDELEKYFRPEPTPEAGDSLLRYFENLPGISFARDTGMKIHFSVTDARTKKFLESIGLTVNADGEFSVKKGRGGKAHEKTLATIQAKIKLQKTHFPEEKNEPMESV